MVGVAPMCVGEVGCVDLRVASRRRVGGVPLSKGLRLPALSVFARFMELRQCMDNIAPGTSGIFAYEEFNKAAFNLVAGVYARVILRRSRLMASEEEPGILPKNVVAMLAQDPEVGVVPVSRGNPLCLDRVFPSEPNPVHAALSMYYGKTITEELVNDMLWRLAAGEGHMSSGYQLENDFVPAAPSWVILQLIEMVHEKASANGNAKLRLMFRILGGPFSGLKFSQVMPFKYVRSRFANGIGYPKFKPVPPFSLVQSLLAGLLQLAKGAACLGEVAATGQTAKFNRALIKKRKDCPSGYSWPCHSCKKGYLGEESCDKATHPFTYIQRPCERCRKRGIDRSWFDPRSAGKVCLECVSHDVKRLTYV